MQLKTAKVIPIHKEGKNQTYPIIDQYHYYQHFQKYMKSSCIVELWNFYNQTTRFMKCNMDLGLADHVSMLY